MKNAFNAFDIVREFEWSISKYTGAPYCVCVNSCTNALFLALKYQELTNEKFYFNYYIEIPKRTYISVPMQIILAGLYPRFRDEKWSGIYQLKPTRIWDSARRFTGGMFSEINKPAEKDYMCVSFHWSKILGIQQGGAILHNDSDFDTWARKARFDGRTEGVTPNKDKFDSLGWHMYMSPEIAAEGLVRLMHLPQHNKDLPNDKYPDLSKIKWERMKV